MFSLDRNGYITNYLYTEIKESLISSSYHDTNQLRYEKYVRSTIAEHDAKCPQKDVKLGEESPLGSMWKYYYSHRNIFLEQSKFFLDLRKVEVMAYTEVYVEEEMKVKALLYSCNAVDLWMNGEKCGEIEHPVYKPIQKKEVEMHLKGGVNQIFIHLQTLGVRDTRISVAIRILERCDDIRITLPEEEKLKKIIMAAELLDQVELHADRLELPYAFSEQSHILYDRGVFDFRKKEQRFLDEDISNKTEIILQPYAAFHVSVGVQGQVFKRGFERIELRKGQFLKDDVKHLNAIQKISEIVSLPRGENDGFAMFPILARYYMGTQSEQDLFEMHVTLKQIERRMDCADFMVHAFTRFLHNYEMPENLKKELKDTMLSFRYWMDEDGQDAMCFWSENHSLIFYSAAYFYGEMYPEEIFVRAHKTGSEMHETGKKLIYDWLKDALGFGFEEFNSGVYTAITFAALLNIVDYAEKELSEMAIEICDTLLRTMALHCFDKVVISPQGRVYRGVLYPHLQGLQSLVHYIDSDAPYVFSEWLICLATSKYEIPSDVIELMNTKGEFKYTTGNATIELCKTEEYMLTSVQSPSKTGKRIWKREERCEMENTHLYTKSINECFHGTMYFEPGVLGYQQHMWYAALARNLVVFVNHPGGSCEDMPEIRPGYWHGNSITPALKQKKNILGTIYQIPYDCPIAFTHVYFPKPLFDEIEEAGNWIFGKKASGMIGLWCSEKMVDHDEVLFSCEKRVYGNEMAYVCICEKENSEMNFSEFIRRCLQKNIQFEQKDVTLTTEEFTLSYKEHENKTQYVD